MVLVIPYNTETLENCSVSFVGADMINNAKKIAPDITESEATGQAQALVRDKAERAREDEDFRTIDDYRANHPAASTNSISALRKIVSSQDYVPPPKLKSRLGKVVGKALFGRDQVDGPGVSVSGVRRELKQRKLELH